MKKKKIVFFLQLQSYQLCFQVCFYFLINKIHFKKIKKNQREMNNKTIIILCQHANVF
jgi:hypothetical protein